MKRPHCYFPAFSKNPAAYNSAALLCAFAAYYAILISRFSVFAFDDAFIHMRVARNIAFHGLPYFNLEETVMGTSPHLWTLLLALGFRIFGESVAPVIGLEVAFLWGSLTLAFLLLRDHFKQFTAALLAGLLLSCFLLNVAAGLMELSGAIFFFLLSAAFLARGNAFCFGLAAGIAVGFRYEMLLWLLAGFWIVPKKLSAFKGALLPGVALLAYCFVFFGTVVPQPAIAKPIVISVPQRYIFDVFIFPGLREALRIPAIASQSAAFSIPHYLAYLSLVTILGYAAFTALRARRISFGHAMAAFPLIVLSIYLVRGHFVYHWYWPMLLFPLNLGLCLVPFGSKQFAVLALAALAQFSWWQSAAQDFYALTSGKSEYFTFFGMNSRTESYRAAGRDLQARAPASTVMAVEVGGLGWEFHGNVIDTMAQVTRTTMKYHPVPLSQRPLAHLPSLPVPAVLELDPDFIVSMPTFDHDFDGERKKNPNFPSYRMVAEYPVFRGARPFAPFWIANEIQVFEKQDSKITDDAR